MPDIRVAQLAVRTVPLTKALLKQFRRITSHEDYGMFGENGQEKLDHVVGWLKGTVLGEQYQDFTLFASGDGDFYLYAHVSPRVRKNCKQVYVP